MASSVTTASAAAARASREHVAPERLRRLRQVDRLARQRRADRPAPSPPTACLTVSWPAPPAIAAPCTAAASIVRSISARRHERPRGIVDGDDVGVRRDAREARATESCRRSPPATARSRSRPGRPQQRSTHGGVPRLSPAAAPRRLRDTRGDADSAARLRSSIVLPAPSSRNCFGRAAAEPRAEAGRRQDRRYAHTPPTASRVPPAMSAMRALV